MACAYLAALIAAYRPLAITLRFFGLEFRCAFLAGRIMRVNRDKRDFSSAWKRQQPKDFGQLSLAFVLCWAHSQEANANTVKYERANEASAAPIEPSSACCCGSLARIAVARRRPRGGTTDIDGNRHGGWLCYIVSYLIECNYDYDDDLLHLPASKQGRTSRRMKGAGR